MWLGQSRAYVYVIALPRDDRSFETRSGPLPFVTTILPVFLIFGLGYLLGRLRGIDAKTLVDIVLFLLVPKPSRKIYYMTENHTQRTILMRIQSVW